MTEWTKECGILYSQEINQLLSIGDNYEDYCSTINGIKVISNFFATIKGYVVSLTLPNNIDIIGNSGLEDCDFLFEIIIPDSVKSIGDYAFSGCNHLYKINLTRNVADIGNGVFSGCDQLNNIIIPIGTKPQFEALLPDYKDKLIEQENGWTVKKARYFDAEELTLVARAEVVSSLDGRSVCFFMMSGGKTYIPLIESSKLTVGDTLDLTKAKIVTLRKGNAEITKIMEISTTND